MVSPEVIFPALVSIIFYLVVLFLAELARKLLDYVVKKNSKLYVFLIELIGTLQMCTCVYENGICLIHLNYFLGIIIKYYGICGFFFVAFTLLIIGRLINRGAYVSPLTPIELFVNGKLRYLFFFLIYFSSDKFLSIIVAQTVGGFAAFRCANALWYYSTAYSSDHFSFYKQLPCAITYKVIYIFWGEL